MNDNRFAGINWERLLKRLTACAASWFLKEGCRHADDILPATGMSAEDLARSAVLEFIRGGIKWDQSTDEEGLYRVVLTAMKRDFLDLVKKGRAYKRTDVLDTYKNEDAPQDQHKKAPVLENLPDPCNDGFYSLEAAVIARQVYPLIGNNAELKELVDAVLYCGETKREDRAELLGITPQQVTDGQRKLRLRLAPWHRRVHESRKSTGH